MTIFSMSKRAFVCPRVRSKSELPFGSLFTVSQLSKGSEHQQRKNRPKRKLTWITANKLKV